MPLQRLDTSKVYRLESRSIYLQWHSCEKALNDRAPQSAAKFTLTHNTPPYQSPLIGNIQHFGETLLSHSGFHLVKRSRRSTGITFRLLRIAAAVVLRIFRVAA